MPMTAFPVWQKCLMSPSAGVAQIPKLQVRCVEEVSVVVPRRLVGREPRSKYRRCWGSENSDGAKTLGP